MKITAIIPARGGSKRISGKNVILLGEKPLISYSIEHARQSKLVNRTIVSTDDDEIARVSRECGAEIIRRPSDLSTDTATSESALLNVIKHLEKNENFCPDLVVFLQCTSPFREKDDIDRAINTLLEQKADALFSAFIYNKYIWHENNGEVTSINFDYKKERWREQDFPVQYQENGSIYVIKPWVLKKNNYRFGGKLAIFEMGYLNSMQIDSYEDLLLCESILERKKGGLNK